MRRVFSRHELSNRRIRHIVHPLLQKNTPLVETVGKRTPVSSIAVQLAAREALVARNAARHVAQRVLELRVDGVVVVLAVVVAAGVAQVVRVAEAAVGDACVVAFLLLGGGTAHGAVDALALTVDGDLVRLVCWRVVGRAVILGVGQDAAGAGVGGGF